MTKIIFSDGSQPVRVYNPLIGPLLPDSVKRENTEGQTEWVSSKELAQVVHKMLPEDVKGQIDDRALRDRIKRTSPEELTDITDLAQNLTGQLRHEQK